MRIRRAVNRGARLVLITSAPSLLDGVGTRIAVDAGGHAAAMRGAGDIGGEAAVFVLEAGVVSDEAVRAAQEMGGRVIIVS
jgi:alanine dehydrogenase